MLTSLRIRILLFLSLIIVFPLAAQHSEVAYYADQQIELKHDNDFLLSTDRYYTTGSFIGYRKLLNPSSETSEKKQLSIYAEQSYFTPSNLHSSHIDEYDRPYAGYLGVNSGLSFTNDKRMLDFTLTIGVTGEISGSQGLQSWFHNTNKSTAPSWKGQIENNTHANLYGSYLREWRVLNNAIQMHVALKPALAMGTKDYYLENEVAIYLGKRNTLQRTMAYRQLGQIENELFFSLKGAYRFVIHDAMLQGSLIQDNSAFTVEPVENLFFYGGEANWRSKRMDFKIAYNFATRRTASTATHGYTTFSVSRNF